MISKTKIIIVAPWFGEFAGGAEVLSKNLALELSNRGIETMIFTTCCKSPYSSWYNNDYEEGEYDIYGIKSFRFSVNNTQKEYEEALDTSIHYKDKMTYKHQENFFIAGINSDRLVKALKSYIEDGYEVIAMPYYQGLTHSVVNAYPNKVSITPCFHDEEAFYYKPIKTLLKNAKHIFYNTQEEKELTIKHYAKTVGKKVVESTIAGVSVELAIHHKEEETQITNIPQEYFIYMGRKEEGKNVHLLVKWFQQYKDENPSNTKLVFMGGGDKSLIPKNDHFIDYGYVSQTDKKKLLKNSIALINLSQNESFSIVIMEAWLSNIPTIVHGKCDVTKGHAIRSNGGLFPSNVLEFIGSLNYLKSHKPQAKAMAINGLDYVEKNYTHDTVLTKYLTTLES